MAAGRISGSVRNEADYPQRFSWDVGDRQGTTAHCAHAEVAKALFDVTTTLNSVVNERLGITLRTCQRWPMRFKCKICDARIHTLRT